MTGALHPTDPHRADEQVALPRREVLAGIKGQPGRRDRRPPEDLRSFELREPWRICYPDAGILAAVGGERPSVVLARLDDVRLVATLRPVLGRPQVAGLGVKGEAELVPVPHRVDLRQVVGVADERVVVDRRPVVVQPHQLAEVDARVLRVRPRLCEHVGASDAHEQRPVRGEQHPGRGDAAVQPLGHEDVADLGQRAPVKATPGQRHRHTRGAITVYRLGIRQVDDAVVVRVKSDVHEPGAVDIGVHLRHSRDGPFQELTVANDPQGARVTLGHQDVAVLSEGHPPGMGELAGDRHHTNPRHLGGAEHHRPVRRRQRRHAVPPLGGRRYADEGEREREREQRTSTPR